MDFELPDSLTFEFLNDLEWKPGPLESYEMCELGLVRRPSSVPMRKGVMQPGYLYAPEIRGPKAVRYRLHKLGSKHPIYVVPGDAVLEIFGRFLNKKLHNIEYIMSLRALVVEFNERYYIQDRRKVYADKCEPGMMPMRFCATCGKQTRNYRCEACWARIKAMSTSCDEPMKEYGFGRR